MKTLRGAKLELNIVKAMQKKGKQMRILDVKQKSQRVPFKGIKIIKLKGAKKL